MFVASANLFVYNITKTVQTQFQPKYRFIKTRFIIIHDFAGAPVGHTTGMGSYCVVGLFAHVKVYPTL